MFAGARKLRGNKEPQYQVRGKIPVVPNVNT